MLQLRHSGVRAGRCPTLHSWVEKTVREAEEEGILQALAEHIKKTCSLVSFPGCAKCFCLRRTRSLCIMKIRSRYSDTHRPTLT